MGGRALAVLVQTKRAEVPWRVLLRNTAAVIVPLGLGIATGRVSVGLAIAVGALVTMYSDQPGPYRQRLARLVAVSAAGALAALIGMIVGGELALLLAATLIVGFVGALLVVFGDAIGRVGMAAMILLAITAAHPANNTEAALHSAALIACGGLLLTGFSIAAWPLQRYGPERAALAGVYRGLAALARQRRVDAGAPPELSDAMTSLQRTLLGPHRARGPVMDSFGVLLELAERIRLELTALAGSDAGGDSGERVARLIRHEVAAVLDDVGGSIAAGTDVNRPIARSLQALRVAEQGSGSGNAASEAAAVRHFSALCGQLAAAARNAARASGVGAVRAEQEDLQLPRELRPQSAFSVLVANLTPRSAAFRHAVRTALCLAVAVWIARLLALPHGYWIPMTVAIVLRADYGATFSYGLLRVAGTVVGLLLTTALLHFLPADPWVWLAVMGVLCVGFRYFGPVHYGVAVSALTGMVVLLLALAGEPAQPTMVSRLIATVIGSAMALTAYGIWPTSERAQIRPASRQLLAAYAAYLGSLGPAAGPHARSEARNAVRVARSNAEAALARLLAEPATPPALAQRMQSLLANSNRLARTSMTLEAVLSASGRLPQRQSLQSLIDQSAAALGQIALSVGSEPRAQAIPLRLPPMPRELTQGLGASDDHGIAAELASLSDRLVDNINTLAHVVARASVASD
ncbi:MAG: FUSC family protein [Steroidobacteraceae bacterium]